MSDYRKTTAKWWDEQCAELEKHERQGKMDLLYKKVSKLTNRKRKKNRTYMYVIKKVMC